ncbi:MAG: V-type ATP synthase subunit I [Lachnospiraceae bacterium]|nr:V-type ATP synthase subunit I [Lachnospiraceae bacterium]
MAVLPMKRINICALKTNRKAILEELQRKGVVEINEVKLDENDETFKNVDLTEQEANFTKIINQTTNALEILEKYSHEQKGLLDSLNGRKPMTIEEYKAFEAGSDNVYKKVLKIIALQKSILENRAEISKTEALIEALEPWKNLDISPNFQGTKYTDVFIGTLPGSRTEEDLYELLANYAPVDASIISVMQDQTCVYVMTTKAQGEGAYETLRANGFARPSVSAKTSPAEQQTKLETQIEALNAEIETFTKEIEEYADDRESFKLLSDYEIMRKEKYAVIEKLCQSKHAFILDGYVAECNAQEIKSTLESKFDIEVLIEDPSPEEEPPIIFKNNWFASPLESVTESYSQPGKGELDPTFSMSLFYYVLFGIMFSDAGYGLMLTVATTIVLAKFKTMEEGMKKFVRMFQFCGISTLFWGIVFGSYFGDIFKVVATTFFNSDFNVEPLWFSANDDPMKMLVFSMALGVVHIFAGLIMKFINCVKNGHIYDGFCDGILWILLVGSCILILMSTEFFMGIIGGGDPISGVLPKIAIGVALASALGVILTAGRESKNPGKRLLKGAYGLYGITSYLSDILSYSRLLALGLATGVIGSVINSMGAMVGNNLIVKAIFFIIIFCIGHVLNFAINILGAYVHTNRLQYVEFFGKFYDGGGRMFAPFSAKTQYYKIKEK